MNEASKISVVINTYNAEQHLQRVIDAVKDFDEVLVCDMESTDRTVSIAKENGCRVVTFAKAVSHHQLRYQPFHAAALFLRRCGCKRLVDGTCWRFRCYCRSAFPFALEVFPYELVQR